MKTEFNNNENKALNKTDVKCRFFAQYFGQKVLHIRNSPIPFNLQSLAFKDVSELDYLSLKSISKITDEDAEELKFTLVNVIGLDGIIRENSKELVKEVISNYAKVDSLFMLPSSCIDKLRKLGYATDWNGVKVSKQIELGWVQLL